MRKRFARKGISIGLVAFLLTCSTFSAYADNKAVINYSGISGQTEDEKVITGELKARLVSEEEFYDVMVYFKEEADTAKAKKNIRKQSVGESSLIRERRAVINALYETSLNSQELVLKWLEKEKEEGNVEFYESFYIVNAIHLKAKKAIIEELAQDDKVDTIEENALIKQDEPIIPVHRQAVSSMAIDEIEWNIRAIGADKVWKEGYTGKGVTVGIMDSAVDIEHPALKTKFKGYDEDKDNIIYRGYYFDAIERKLKPEDDTDVEHGSHCMGIILGSENDNGMEINRIGVAPDAKFISARVFGNNGESSTAAFLSAAQWMLAPEGKAANAPQIINNSWGGGSNQDTWFRRSVKAWRDANILPIFAAGNQQPGEPLPGPKSISIPAGYAESFAVGAVDIKRKLASFSKRGPSNVAGVDQMKPEISAPGVNIRSAIRNSYAYMSGTSMASPHVTGVAALMKSSNNSLGVESIERILKNTAVPATDNEYPNSPNYGYGYGTVSAYAAVMEAQGKGNGTVSGSVMSEGKPVSAEISVKGSQRAVFNDASSGAYLIKYPVGEFTLVCKAYGYIPVEKEVKIKKGETVKVDFNLEKKGVGKLSVSVKDSKNNPLEGAYVNIVEDDRIEAKKTGALGKLTMEKLPFDTYTLRVFKDGYSLAEKQVKIVSSDIKEVEIVLENKAGKYQVKEYKYDNGKRNPISDHNMPVGQGGYGGAAVKFVPEYKGGFLTDVSINFFDRTRGYQGDKAKLDIKSIDSRGRLVEVLSDYEVDFIPGETKTVSLEKEKINIDSPFYIIVKSYNSTTSGFLVGMDRTGNADNSYVLSGSNLEPIDKVRVYGSLMIRASMSYPLGADEIVYNVEPPVLDKIYPDKNEISGKTKANQEVQVVLANDVKLNTKANAEGIFKVILRKKLLAGEEVSAYTKNIEGISSAPAKGLVLNNLGELKKVVLIAGSFKTKNEGSTANDKLRQLIQISELFIKEVESYNEQNNLEKIKIREYQEQADEKVAELKNAILDLSPEKKELKQKIDSAREYINSIMTSSNGKEVPETRYWVRRSDWSSFNNKILAALIVYDKADATKEEIDKALANLLSAREKFDLKKKKGKQYLIIIDDRYKDGKYEGEGRGNNLLASHVVITIKSGKLIDINITDWNESEEAKAAILRDGYIERILGSNSLDVDKTKGYEKECTAIIKAITQAAQKALKEGKSTNIDKTLLIETIEKANSIISSYPVSRDGKDIGKGKQWTLKRHQDELKKALNDANEWLKKEALTIDELNKAVTLLTIAIKNFETNLNTGIIEEENVSGYKDGVYIESSLGYNRQKPNKFKIEIKDGKIKSVSIEEWADTPNRINYINEAKFFENIIKNNSPEIDTVSGATLSANSIKEAVRKALEKAAIKDSDAIDTNKELRLKLAKNIFKAKELIYLSRGKNMDRQDFINAVKEAEKLSKDSGAGKKDIESALERLDKAIQRFKK